MLFIRCNCGQPKHQYWQQRRKYGGHRYWYDTYRCAHRRCECHLGCSQWCGCAQWQLYWLLFLPCVTISSPSLASGLAMARAKGVKTFYMAKLTVIFDFLSPACGSKLNIAISFGGPAWPINDDDLNVGTISSGHCLGAIFDITAGSNVKPSSGTPSWIVGDTFLVRIFS